MDILLCPGPDSTRAAGEGGRYLVVSLLSCSVPLMEVGLHKERCVYPSPYQHLLSIGVGVGFLYCCSCCCLDPLLTTPVPAKTRKGVFLWGWRNGKEGNRIRDMYFHTDILFSIFQSSHKSPKQGLILSRS